MTQIVPELDSIRLGKICIVARTRQEVEDIAKMHRIPLQEILENNKNEGWMGLAIVVKKYRERNANRVDENY